VLTRKTFLIAIGLVLSVAIFAVIVFAALWVKFALIMAGPPSGCPDEPNFVIERQASPDGKWIAERVDTTCGENESQRLWVRRPNEALVDFPKFSSVTMDVDTHFTWSDAGELILYGNGSLASEKPTNLRGVNIVFQGR
jgi:hypothetical protein